MMMGLGKRVISDKGIASPILKLNVILFNKNNRLTKKNVEYVFNNPHFRDDDGSGEKEGILACTHASRGLHLAKLKDLCNLVLESMDQPRYFHKVSSKRNWKP